MDESLMYVIGVILLFAIGFALRWGARYYANTQVAAVMLGAEKRLSTWAKEKAADGADKRKASVYLIANKVYPKLPAMVKLFVTQDMLVASIDKIYAKMLDYLDDGAINDSVT